MSLDKLPHYVSHPHIEIHRKVSIALTPTTSVRMVLLRFSTGPWIILIDEIRDVLESLNNGIVPQLC